MAALARQGLSVAPFKVGPDFIDPGHHSRITGKISRNLDGWMLPKKYNLACFKKHSANADVAIVEGVMGLFDGYDGKTEAGSTAQMAKWTGLPVILVVNAKSMARSAAALVQGFENFDKKLSFAGVIFNNIGSERHLEYLREALENNVDMPCLGGILRDKDITIPERHLGLVTDNDHPLSEKNKEKLADLIEKSIDIQYLLNILPDIPPDIQTAPEFKQKHTNTSKKCVNIGVARDNAFCFYYQDNLDMLQENGANLVFFSPIKDKRLPENLDGLYFGGGYPELFAKDLAENRNLAAQIREKSINGMPIYGECGGFMYLCRKIYTHDGREYPMSGSFPFTTRMFTKLKALGYREIALSQDTIIGRKGTKIKGHEFHYSETDDLLMKIKIENIYKAENRSGNAKKLKGYMINNTLGSYCHLHFGSCPDAAKTFINACLTYNKDRGTCF